MIWRKKKKLNSSTKTYLFNSIILSKRHAAGYQRNTFHIELKSWPLGSSRSWLTPWPWHLPDDWSANLSLSFLSNRVRTTSEDHYPHASPLKGLLYSDPRVPAEPAWRCLPCCGSGPPPLSLWSSLRVFPTPGCCGNTCSLALLPHLLLTLSALGLHFPPPPILAYSCLCPSPLTPMLNMWPYPRRHTLSLLSSQWHWTGTTLFYSF